MPETPASSSTDLTIGELCLAIGDGRLPARLEDEYYTVTRREITRYLSDQVLSELAAPIERHSE